MIASSAVARWTWGRDEETPDLVEACLRAVTAAYRVLAEHRLAVGTPRAHVTLRKAGASNSLLHEGDTPIVGSVDHRALAAGIEESRMAGEAGSVHASVGLSGTVVGVRGQEQVQDGLFRLGSSAYAGYVTTDLVTYGDFWLPYDLKGRAQAGVHAANAPRLTAALAALADALGAETDPDDPTWFAKPSETGIDNYFDPGGSASDVWDSFEVLYGSGRVSSTRRPLPKRDG
ncbi:hypothetical protein [Streptomyces mesophilus]|uniref:hypothetical protein n=1 Tax=Streptomyces mesophilus TaxID=1775132 RepID=UPI00332F54FA